MIDPEKTPLVPSAQEASPKGATLLQLAQSIGSPPAIFEVLVGRWQGTVPQEKLERYRPLAKAIAAAKGSDALDAKRAWRCVDWVVRTFIAEHAKVIGWPGEGDTLSGLPPIEGAEALKEADIPMRRLGTRALLVSGAAQAVRQTVGLPMGHLFEKAERWKIRAMMKDYGHPTGELDDVRPYPGLEALGHAGLPAINALLRWPDLVGVRSPLIPPTLGCAEEVQHAAAVAVSQEKTDALEGWLCDSFYGVLMEIAKMKESPVRRSRKAS
jgi:hypothetical protein